MPVNPLILGLLVAASAVPVQAGSARIELEVVPGITAEADYWPGEADKPAVLILHGFLQTREFPTVRRLAEALADEGYSVLTPSLTLGLNRRRQSLACEAIHTHSLQQDLVELRAWTAWLAQRTAKPPVLVGHSSGALQLAAMLDADPAPAIGQAVLISPSTFGEEQDPQRLAEYRARAAEQLARGDQEMHAYPLLYCTQYVTTAANLASYLDWDRERLRAALSKGVGAPVTVIYGDRDEHVDQAWLAGLGAHGVGLRPVAGANHFFDLEHEFDLLDEVLELISGARHG